jgi:hypothetical protein
VQRAIADAGALAYAVGERWGPEPQGLKVHGLAYTAERSAREGWTLVF